MNLVNWGATDDTDMFSYLHCVTCKIIVLIRPGEARSQLHFSNRSQNFAATGQQQFADEMSEAAFHP